MLKQIIGQSLSSADREEKRFDPAPAPVAAVDRAPVLSSAPTISQPQRSFASSSPMMSSSKNVLANDVEIKGSIKFSHDLIIDGKIEGEVISDGSLTVGENALI